MTVAGVLVLNADTMPLHTVSLRHAVRMLCRQVAEIHEAVPDRLIGVFPMPKIVRLITYIAPRWRFSSGPRWSRPGVLARDNRTCGYCGRAATTIDHIHPRSRGGKNTWLNTVAACGRCNQRKGDASLAESGMRLRTPPTAPTWASLVGR